jgi:hypothetical protein
VWNWVHVYNANLAFVLDNTNTIYQLDLLGNTASVVAGAPLSNFIAVTNDGYLYAAATNNGSNGNLYSYQFNSASPAWVNLKGTAYSVWGRLSDVLIFLSNAPSAGTPYHFLASAKYMQTQLSGYYDCSRFPNGCPVGSMHTVKATVSYPGGYSPGTSSASGTPSSQIGTVHWDVAGGCDLFFGDPNDPECFATANTDAVCSKMGDLGGSSFQESPPTTAWGWVLIKNPSGPGGGTNCSTYPVTKIKLCDYKTAQWCTNQPAYTVSSIRDISPGPLSWTLFYKCVILSNGVYGPCWAPPGAAVETNTLGPMYCVNP